MTEPTRQVNLYGQTVTVLDEPVGQYVFDGCEKGNWKPELFKVFDTWLKPGEVSVNIGAFAGATTLYPAMLGCHVYAIEPDPEAYRVLLRNIMLNETACRNVQAVLGCAISDQNGAVRLQNRGDYGSSKSRLTTPDYTASAPVACMTLSHALAAMNCPTPDFVKINVQGYEARLLRQAAPMLCEAKATVHVYVRPANWPDAALDAKALAYVLTRWPNVYTESGERISPAVITSPEWLAKSDYKLLASFKEWPVA